jgi:outer membrane protein assembly factor BamB
LLRAFRQSSTVFLLYGADGTRARYLVASNASSHRQRYAFDFGRFMRPPLTVRADAELVTEQLVWAREADGVLYTESAHQTYAASSHGRNAYVTAVSIPSGRILWRSRALVANASTFVLAGAAIVTGYGFTSEPDYLYLLDRSTGRVRDRLPVPSAPERIVRHGRRLAVRTYDRELVVDLRPP